MVSSINTGHQVAAAPEAGRKPNAEPAQVASAVRVSEALKKGAAANAERSVSAEPAKLGAVVASINDYLQDVRRDLQFSVDEGSGRVIVTVINAETGDIVRQIPPEEVLRLAEGIKEQDGDSGLFVREQV